MLEQMAIFINEKSSNPVYREKMASIRTLVCTVKCNLQVLSVCFFEYIWLYKSTFGSMVTSLLKVGKFNDYRKWYLFWQCNELVSSQKCTGLCNKQL